MQSVSVAVGDVADFMQFERSIAFASMRDLQCQDLEKAPKQRPLVTSGRFCIHASRNHIQHIATVAQRYAAEQCEVAENDRVSGDVTPHREVFKNLRHGSDSVAGRAEQ